MKSEIRPFQVRGAVLAALLLCCGGASGQVPPPVAPPVQDPLMGLLLSQPRIDFSAPVKPTASFEPSVVRPGEEAIYRVNLTALEASIEWPEKLSAPPGLEMRAGGRGQLLQMAGPAMEARTSFNYHVRAKTAGNYTMPAFKVNVYGKAVTIPAAQLSVDPGVPRTNGAVQKLEVELASTNLYVGQTVKVRVSMLFPPGGLQTLSQVQFNGNGLLVDPTAARQLFEQAAQGAPGAVKYVYETLLTPIASGTLSFFAQGFSASRLINQNIVSGTPASPGLAIAYSTIQYNLLDSDPVQIRVRALPTKGEMPGFTGAIGVFAVEPPKLATNRVRVGEPVKLSVTVRGDANMARLVPPPPPSPKEWQVFAAASVDTPAPLIHMQASRTFIYTLAPLTAAAHATPAIPFSYFDPETGAYKDLTIPSVPVDVVPGAARVDIEALELRAREDREREPEPVLSELAPNPGPGVALLTPVQQRAWFPFVELAPGIAFGCWWAWERRRRYLEAHPEVVRCRRARRVLRRERRVMRRAGREGDAPRFAAAAVNAIQAAVAPHYPADPRSLVGGDVPEALGEAKWNGPEGEAVRRLFAIMDAKRFGTATPQLEDVLPLRPGLEQAIDTLEVKLCG